MLLYFKYANHFNYQEEVFLLLACFCEYRYLKIASELKWSQTGNTRGGLGRSVPIDLHMEHLNHNVKFTNLGASVAESTIVQCGKSLDWIMVACNQFDRESGVRQPSQSHARSKVATDQKKIIKELTETSCVFDYVPG